MSFSLEAPLADHSLAFFILTLVLSRLIPSFSTNVLTFSKYPDVQSACQVASVVSDSFATPMDCSPPGSSVLGVLQARMLEWVAMPSSRGSSRLTQGLNLGLLHCRQTLYHLSHQGRLNTRTELSNCAEAPWLKILALVLKDMRSHPRSRKIERSEAKRLFRGKQADGGDLWSWSRLCRHRGEEQLSKGERAKPNKRLRGGKWEEVVTLVWSGWEGEAGAGCERRTEALQGLVPQAGGRGWAGGSCSRDLGLRPGDQRGGGGDTARLWILFRVESAWLFWWPECGWGRE